MNKKDKKNKEDKYFYNSLTKQECLNRPNPHDNIIAYTPDINKRICTDCGTVFQEWDVEHYKMLMMTSYFYDEDEPKEKINKPFINVLIKMRSLVKEYIDEYKFIDDIPEDKFNKLLEDFEVLNKKFFKILNDVMNGEIIL